MRFLVNGVSYPELFARNFISCIRPQGGLAQLGGEANKVFCCLVVKCWKPIELDFHAVVGCDVNVVNGALRNGNAVFQ